MGKYMQLWKLHWLLLTCMSSPAVDVVVAVVAAVAAADAGACS